MTQRLERYENILPPKVRPRTTLTSRTVHALPRFYTIADVIPTAPPRHDTLTHHNPKTPVCIFHE